MAQVIEFPFRHGGLQWSARRSWSNQLRGKFHRAYVLPNSFKGALLPFMAGIEERIGYTGEARLGLLTQRLPNPPKGDRPPMVGFYSRLSGASAQEVALDRPRLSLSEAQLALGLAELGRAIGRSEALERGGHHVFATGAEYGPAKRWPTEHWAALAARMNKPVLLLGSPKEVADCQAIADLATPANAERSGARVFNLAGQTSLATAFAAIATADSMVTNDSGLMHVAAALDVPQVAIFGSSSPEHTPPLSAAAQVIWLKRDADLQPPLNCAPCFQRACPKPAGPDHLRCLRAVSADRVAALLQRQS